MRADAARGAVRRAALTCAFAATHLLASPAAGTSTATPPPDETVSASRVIRVGLRDDAKPFSYRGRTGSEESVLAGHRGYMVEICRRVLRDMVSSGPFRGFSVEVEAIEAKDRFERLASGGVDLLCGPDSITSSRLRRYAVSHPMFVSGLTYAYLDPTQGAFPRARHCGHVVGVVRGTTAESNGLRMMADEGLLLRFDEALEVYLANEPELTRRKREAIVSLLPKDWDAAIKEVQGKASGLFVTGECPRGFVDGLPVRLFDNHDEGIRDFCDGKVPYYLGDYDIITRKIEAAGDCPVVIERFTRTKEVYGAFFRAGFDAAVGESGTIGARAARDALLYAVFNHTLLRMMQTEINILEFEFEREFGSAEKSEDLIEFFESFRVVSDR